VNEWYWPAKIERNRARDRDTDEKLAHAGWLVIRVWEHEVAEHAATRIVEAVVARRSALQR
jgi:DNA mismatch endonuclease (patch repair protein)